MVIHALGQLPNKEGSIDDILHSMIHLFGKDKLCEQTGSMILSFED